MLWLAQFSQHLVLLGFVKLRSTVASKKELEPKGSKSAKLETFFLIVFLVLNPGDFGLNLICAILSLLYLQGSNSKVQHILFYENGFSIMLYLICYHKKCADPYPLREFLGHCKAQ